MMRSSRAHQEGVDPVLLRQRQGFKDLGGVEILLHEVGLIDEFASMGDPRNRVPTNNEPGNLVFAELSALETLHGLLRLGILRGGHHVCHQRFMFIANASHQSGGGSQ